MNTTINVNLGSRTVAFYDESTGHIVKAIDADALFVVPVEGDSVMLGPDGFWLVVQRTILLHEPEGGAPGAKLEPKFVLFCRKLDPGDEHTRRIQGMKTPDDD